MIKLGLWKCLHCWNGSPKKWWTLPCWLFSTLQRCRLLKSIFCMSERERVQIFPVVPGWTVKRLPLWLYWGSKSLVATCKTEPLSLLGCPSCRPVTDRMVTWRKITSKVKVEVKAAEVQEAHCGVTWKTDGRSDGTMRSYIFDVDDWCRRHEYKRTLYCNLCV